LFLAIISRMKSADCRRWGMKQPTCDCIGYKCDLVQQWAKIEYKVEHEWHDGFFDLNFCPQCGKPYEEVEHE
jgi:hypothetical protein